MTLAATIIGLVLVLEDTNLGTFAVFDDGARDLRAFDERTPEFNFLALADSQDFLERDGSTFLNVKLFDYDLATLGDLVLFAAGLDDCVQPEHLHTDELADFGTITRFKASSCGLPKITKFFEAVNFFCPRLVKIVSVY